MKKHPNDPPACAECRHKDGGWCYQDDNSEYSPVNGRERTAASYARSTAGHCGLSGKDFEPRDPPTWLDKNIGRIVLGIIVLTLIGYFSKQAGVFG